MKTSPAIPFTYDHLGTELTGTYTVKDGMITVTTKSGSKTTQVGGLPPPVLAKMLAGELARTG